MDKLRNYLIDTYSIDVKGPKQNKAKDLKEFKDKLLDDKAAVKLSTDDPIDDLVNFIKLIKDGKISELVDALRAYDDADDGTASQGAIDLFEIIFETFREQIQKKEQDECMNKRRKKQNEFMNRITLAFSTSLS